MADDKVMQQDRSQDAPDLHQLIWVQLLFEEEPERPAPEAFRDALTRRFGRVDAVTQSAGGLYSFAVHEFPVRYQDATVPAQVLMAAPAPFSPDELSVMERSQLWDVRDSGAFLARCRHKVMLSDFMASGLPYKERCRLINVWLETALELFPAAIGVWVPSSGKLLERENIVNNPLKEDCRFLWYGVNVRFFNIQGSEDKVMDTLGMYAIGLPDVQLHFRGINPDLLVNYLYNIANYLYDNNAPVKSGETIDGIDGQGRIVQDIQWTCQYERALIQPVRDVMDICPGQFAAGRRGGSKNANKKY